MVTKHEFQAICPLHAHELVWSYVVRFPYIADGKARHPDPFLRKPDLETFQPLYSPSTTPHHEIWRESVRFFELIRRAGFLIHPCETYLSSSNSVPFGLRYNSASSILLVSSTVASHRRWWNPQPEWSRAIPVSTSPNFTACPDLPFTLCLMRATFFWNIRWSSFLFQLKMLDFFWVIDLGKAPDKSHQPMINVDNAYTTTEREHSFTSGVYGR